MNRRDLLLLACHALACVGLAAEPTCGPLRVHPDNPRYFADATGRAVLLAGSHTWGNFKDFGPADPPPAFDYAEFLSFLARHDHNFIRLWSWELPHSTLGKSPEKWRRDPFPWQRTGPGLATDGKPRFDFTKENPAYYQRLRERVKAAAASGVYVSVMLWDGYGPKNNRGPDDGFPFDRANNVNGIACDGKYSQSLKDPAVTAVQEAYVRRVIATLNDLDNVLYEIANEPGGTYSVPWQAHFIRFVRTVQAGLPNRHPVGMTVPSPQGTNEMVFRSEADWVSPNGYDGFGAPVVDPPGLALGKVVINDTDHSFYWSDLITAGPVAMRAWAWKTFTRGHNLAFMDPYLVTWPKRNAPNGTQLDPRWQGLRENLGHVRRVSRRLDLAKCVPRDDLATTRYCLASAVAGPGTAYVIYAPEGGEFSVDLMATPGPLAAEWLNPADGSTTAAPPVTGGARKQKFRAPFEGDAVLLLLRQTQ